MDEPGAAPALNDVKAFHDSVTYARPAVKEERCIVDGPKQALQDPYGIDFWARMLLRGFRKNSM